MKAARELLITGLKNPHAMERQPEEMVEWQAERMVAVAGDEVLKNTFGSNALEHFEITAYKSLLAMADRAGIAMRSVLEQSLREEERMARWVDRHVESLTLQYMQKEA